MFNSKFMYSMAVASALIIPAFVITVDAEELKTADGTYEVNFLTYKTGTTATSGMANRFEQPAKLVVENGEAKLQLNIITQNSMMGMLTLPYKGTATQMTTISGDISTETRVIELPIDTFNKAITVDVDVVFPGSATPVRQTFDLIVASPEEEIPFESVKITAYQYGTVKESFMQQFLVSTAKVQLQDDHSVVHITVNNKNDINKLIINGEEAQIITEEGSNVTFAAKVKDTKQLLDATVEINDNGTTMTQKAQLHLAVKGATVMIENPFSDIDDNDNKAAILNLLNKGIINSAEKFNPGNSLTRGQFALMVARTLKLGESSDAGFKDIAALKSSDVERYHAINALAAANVIKKQDHFKPNATITRQQAALMIYRAMQYHVGTNALDFGNNISVYADDFKVKDEESQRALSFLYASNAMTGTVATDGKRYIEPTADLKRGQMAKVLNGTLKYLGH